MDFIDLKSEYLSMKEEIDSAIMDVVESRKFIMGDVIRNFESEYSNYLGAKHAIGVSSGTDALLVCLIAAGIKPGDEVITTPFTFIATVEVISLLSAKPVFVDIKEDTFNIDPSLIREKITDKTKAIIPVHLYGQCADMDEIMAIAKENDLFVIEDTAQAFGSKYKGKFAGTIADTGAFSFFPSKNIGCFGDGGMIVTDNDEIADKLHKLRLHGSAKKYEHDIIGVNARLDTIQAAILRVKLKGFDDRLKTKIERAEYYNEKLKDTVTVPFKEEFNLHTYGQYTIKTEKRDELKAYFGENKIPCAVHYPIPIHMQKAYEFLNYKKGDLPASEKVAEQVISLPMSSFLQQEDQDIVINKIKEFI